jgi:DNA mismatch repair protein MutL
MAGSAASPAPPKRTSLAPKDNGPRQKRRATLRSVDLFSILHRLDQEMRATAPRPEIPRTQASGSFQEKRAMEPTTPPPSSGLAPCRIQVLPSDLANQIAAGEVVARPASALKELCENSIDAGATSLEVEIDGGGITRLSVTDDGSGMTRQEALLALERHATSKIRSVEDLFHISTMGFRGEALPSIASVSRFSLTTRRRDDVVGSLIEVEGGQPPKARDAGCAPGTRVEIRDLFFNTPARRKFLKTEANERAHAIEAVTRLALARPEVSFRVRADGREAFSGPKTNTLKQRAAQVLGRKVAEELYPFREEAFGISFEGLLGHPGLARSGTKGISLFVNRRYVSDRTIAQALASAYGGLVDKGKYPLAILWIEIDPAKIDVNVHPAKEEIRFSDPQKIFAAVRKAAVEGLRTTPWLGSEFYAMGRQKPPMLTEHGEVIEPVPNTQFTPVPLPNLSPMPAPRADSFAARVFSPENPPLSASIPNTGEAGGLESVAASLSPLVALAAELSSPEGAPAGPRLVEVFADAPPEDAAPRRAPLSPLPSGRDTQSGPAQPVPLAFVPVSAPEQAEPGRALSSPLSAQVAPAPLAPSEPQRPAFFRAMRPVGQIKTTYLLLETGNGLVIIDQHAAHERVTYERLKRSYERRSISRQRLLFPATVDLAPTERAACETFSQELLAVGLEVEPFGPHTVAVVSVPQLLSKSDPEKLLKSALDDLAQKEVSLSLDERVDHALATMACHGSVRAGKSLSQEEILSLLAAMDETDLAGNCPHGRPVYLELSWKELEKRFGRLGGF